MRNVLFIALIGVFIFGYNHLSFARCEPTGPDQFQCNAFQPNPDPNGVQQGVNNNGVQVHVLKDGNVDTSNSGGGSGNANAIDLGSGTNHIDIINATVVGEDRAINTGSGPDDIMLNRANLESPGSTIFLDPGNDSIVIKDSKVTTAVGGITISVGPGDDVATITGSNLSAGPNVSRVFTGGPGDDDVTIKNSTITNTSSDVTVSLGADNDKVFVFNTTITNATADFPLRGAAGDDELTIGTGAIIPGGIDCDFDTEPQGFDTLIFAMVVPAKQIANLTDQIENLPTPEGAITINGIFYEYRNCDVVVAALRDSEPRPIPTLSKWGLVTMAEVLGIIAILAIRRRKLTA